MGCKSRWMMGNLIENWSGWWWLEPWNFDWLSISSMGVSSSHWRTPSFFKRLKTCYCTTNQMMFSWSHPDGHISCLVFWSKKTPTAPGGQWPWCLCGSCEGVCRCSSRCRRSQVSDSGSDSSGSKYWDLRCLAVSVMHCLLKSQLFHQIQCTVASKSYKYLEYDSSHVQYIRRLFVH